MGNICFFGGGGEDEAQVRKYLTDQAGLISERETHVAIQEWKY